MSDGGPILRAAASSALGALCTALLAAAAAAPPAPARAAPSCPKVITRAGWVRAAQGWRLIVVPSACGRPFAASHPRAAFDQAIKRAAPPRGHARGWDPSPGSLLEQFACHAEFAPRKPSWDLEAWRPPVPWLIEVLDLCNPP